MFIYVVMDIYLLFFLGEFGGWDLSRFGVGVDVYDGGWFCSFRVFGWVVWGVLLLVIVWFF